MDDRFNLDKFIATAFVSAPIFYNRQFLYPLIFSTSLNILTKFTFDYLAKEEYISKEKANTYHRAFNIIFPISFEYLKPPFQTALSNYFSPMQSIVLGKIGALIYASFTSKVHDALFNNQDATNDTHKNKNEDFSICNASMVYSLQLLIREIIDYNSPKIYGFKPFGTIISSYLIFPLKNKGPQKNDDEQFFFFNPHAKHVLRSSLEYLYNELQLRTLAKIPLLRQERLLKHIVNDWLRNFIVDISIGK